MKNTIIHKGFMFLPKIAASIVSLCIVYGSLATFSVAEAATVKSLSREIEFKNDVTSYIQVRVNCTGIIPPRIISRKVGTSEWCSDEYFDKCYSKKIRAARKICSVASKIERENKNTLAVENTPSASEKVEPVAAKPSFAGAESKAVTSDTSVTSAIVEPIAEPIVAKKAKVGPNGKTRSDLMKEYIAIEEQRISVEQQKIELSKRELELQKRELAL